MDIKDFRQPMVTSIGVVLGFLVGFLGQWVTEPQFRLASSSDYLVFSGSLAGVLLLLLTLYRMLSPLDSAEVRPYYQRTLRLYVLGVLVPLSSMVLSAFI